MGFVCGVCVCVWRRRAVGATRGRAVCTCMSDNVFDRMLENKCGMWAGQGWGGKGGGGRVAGG